jgi:hypothetical protein
MKILLVNLAILMGFAGCDSYSPEAGSQEHTPPRPTEITKQTLPLINRPQAPEQEPKKFEINFGKLHLTATVDEKGNVSILDYPTEWHTKARVVRYIDPTEKAPFSNKYCEGIRALAEIGGTDIVRGGYFSELIFEVAPFLSENFVAEVEKAAKAAGFDMPIFIINPVDIYSGVFEMTLGKKAISPISGHLDLLQDGINLSYRGIVKNSFEQELIIRSADIICDLVSGEARFSMTYKTEREGRVVKVIYDPMEVKLKPR